VSILHIESFGNRGDEGLLANTDCGTGGGACPMSLAVDFDAEELEGRAKIGDYVLFRDPGLDLNRRFGRVCRKQH